jgi:opacity protein-like surface antigen
MKNILLVFLTCLVPLAPLSALASETPVTQAKSLLDYSAICRNYEQSTTTLPDLYLKKGLSLNQTDATPKTSSYTDTSDVDLGSRAGLTALTFKNPSGVSPYLGAGVASTDEVKKKAPGPTASVPKEGNIYAYELGAGIGCNLDSSTKLNFGYRYATNAGTGLTQEDALQSDMNPVDQGHQISMGLQVGF